MTEIGRRAFLQKSLAFGVTATAGLSLSGNTAADSKPLPGKKARETPQRDTQDHQSRSTKTYEVKRLSRTRRVSIDGHGGDPAWEAAVILDDFSFPWLDNSAPRTVFRGLWNDDHFYFLFNVTDADIVLAEGANAKQRVIGSDRVEIFFSTGQELKPYYALEMDPRGDVLDYRANYYREMDWDWVCKGLQTTATQNQAGYVVEGSIPMLTLEQCLHEDDEGLYLIAGLFRGEFSHGEPGQVIENWISWVNPQVSQPDFHVPSAFGKLKLSKP